MNKTAIKMISLGILSFYGASVLALETHAQIYFDGRTTTRQTLANRTDASSSQKVPNDLLLSRIRIDMNGDLSEIIGDITQKWSYHVRLEKNEHKNSQLNLDSSGWSPSADSAYSSSTQAPFVSEGMLSNSAVTPWISQAELTWHFSNGMSLSFGRVECPDVTSDRIGSQFYIGSSPQHFGAGSLIGSTGNHAGVTSRGQVGQMHYHVGIWNQTNQRELETYPAAPGLQSASSFSNFYNNMTVENASTVNYISPDFDTKSLRLGYGGRVSYSKEILGAMMGAGVGYTQAPLNAPISIITLSEINNNIPSYSMALFNNLRTFALDVQGVYNRVAFGAGYESEKLNLQSEAAYFNSGYTAPRSIFAKDGKAYSYWAQVGYLLFGKEYRFDEERSTLAGVMLDGEKAGLEIALRYGYTQKTNVLALIDSVGWTDFSSNTTNSPASASSAAMLLANAYTAADTNTNPSNIHHCLEIFVDNRNPPGGNGTQISTESNRSYAISTQTWSVHMNYYISENAVLKMEYERSHHRFQRYYTGSRWMDSLNSNSVGIFRVRGDYSF